MCFSFFGIHPKNMHILVMWDSHIYLLGVFGAKISSFLPATLLDIYICKSKVGRKQTNTQSKALDLNVLQTRKIPFSGDQYQWWIIRINYVFCDLSELLPWASTLHIHCIPHYYIADFVEFGIFGIPVTQSFAKSHIPKLFFIRSLWVHIFAAIHEVFRIEHCANFCIFPGHNRYF